MAWLEERTGAGAKRTSRGLPESLMTMSCFIDDDVLLYRAVSSVFITHYFIPGLVLLSGPGWPGAYLLPPLSFPCIPG